MNWFHALSQKALLRLMLALTLATVVLLNLCAGLAVEKFGLRLDFTGERLYALSPVTGELAAALAEPVEIHILSTRADYPAMFREILDRFGRLSDRITVRYVDPYANPRFLEHYRQLGYALADSDLLVEGPAGVRRIAAGDLLLYQDGEPYGVQLEQQLAAALVYVSSPEKRTAVLTAGHNERPSTALEKLFADNNFLVETRYLGANDPLEADVVVIPSPARDFTPEEIAALEDYLSGGGRVMLFLEPGQAHPQLEAFLARWGLAVQDDLVYEERAYLLDNPLNLVPRYAPHPMNTYFTDNQYFVVMPSARSLRLEGEGLGALRIQAVLYSSSEAYAKSGDGSGGPARQAGDATGPFPLAATAEQDVVTDGGPDTAMVFLAGSRYLYADDIMGTPTYANREFLAQAVGYLTDGGATVTIPPKTLAAPAIAARPEQTVMAAAFLVAVLPLGAVAAGVLVTRERRRR